MGSQKHSQTSVFVNSAPRIREVNLTPTSGGCGLSGLLFFFQFVSIALSGSFGCLGGSRSTYLFCCCSEACVFFCMMKGGFLGD